MILIEFSDHLLVDNLEQEPSTLDISNDDQLIDAAKISDEEDEQLPVNVSTPPCQLTCSLVADYGSDSDIGMFIRKYCHCLINLQNI